MIRYLFVFTVVCLVSRPARTEELHVLAAASLADALTEAAANYEKLTGDDVVLNFGASSTLARQIQQGAPADLYISADEARMDLLQKEGLILRGSRRSILTNTLVIVTGRDSRLSIRSAADLRSPAVKRIALANPESVPAGIYARRYLVRQRLWPSLAPKVIPTDNVRSTLAAVESGNVEAGLVYRTDALISKRVKIAAEIPRGETNISYPFAVLTESRNRQAASRFLAYLDSKAGRSVFVRHGFGLK
jgi:molybdate transport system substrate-binding protein